MENTLDVARKNLQDKLTFCYGDGKGGCASLGYGLQRVVDLAVYECAKKYIAAYEENYFGKDFAEEMAKSPLQVMPLPKPNTAIDIEINESCFYKDVRHLIEKICKDHEGKHDLRITIKDLRIHCTDLESEENE